MSEFHASERGFLIPGKRVVIEGNDGTGKSTTADMVSWQIRQNGFNTLRIDEPNGPIDDDGTILLPHISRLRDIIKDGTHKHYPISDFKMFSMSRFISWHSVTKPQMHEQGVWPIQARDYTSSDAYQGNGDGLTMEFTSQASREFMDDELYFDPDFKTVLIFRDEIERLERIKNRAVLEKPDTFESRDPEFQRRVNEGYIVIAKRDGLDVTEIEAGQSREEIADIVLEKMIGKIGVSLTLHSWELYWEEKREIPGFTGA